MGLSKFLKVSFKISPAPSSAAEVNYLHKSLSKIAPIAQFNYRATNEGKYSMRYPNLIGVLYETDSDATTEVVGKLNKISGLPRLSHYNKLFQEDGLAEYQFDESLETITKYRPIYFKKYNQSLKWPFHENFSIACSIKGFKEMEAINKPKSEQKLIKSRLNVETQGFFERRYKIEP
ncbi:hypothetical protein DASC09_061740 [Saccharomycopsis crataegensis]|uniref:Uncharacterized protein n=1 Tax=Saccharomycopsis crataegensis TaxID=43959 RepID=A0AAV5QW44_9ASCO|nr:hypothetical protein DASC09_061740 [Saccharomycopsis crataegensis]